LDNAATHDERRGSARGDPDQGQQVPGSDSWPRIVMTATKDPLTELAARLAAVGGPDALAVRDGLA